MNPQKLQDLPDLVDDLFIKHDLNLLNFITRLNLKLREQGIADITHNAKLDFSMISEDGHFPIPRRTTAGSTRSICRPASTFSSRSTSCS